MGRPPLQSAAVLLLTLLCALTAASCSDEPGQPPGSADADTAAVRSVAQSWQDALSVGDAHKAHAMLVDDAVQRAFVADHSRFTAAVRRLEAAAVAEFGDAGKGITGYPDPRTMAGAMQVRVEGDRATVTQAQAMLPLTLRRVNGQWKIDLADTMTDRRARDLPRRSRAVARVLEKLADEVAAGQFASAHDARAALDVRRRQALSIP